MGVGLWVMGGGLHRLMMRRGRVRVRVGPLTLTCSPVAALWRRPYSEIMTHTRLVGEGLGLGLRLGPRLGSELGLGLGLGLGLELGVTRVGDLTAEAAAEGVEAPG